MQIVTNIPITVTAESLLDRKCSDLSSGKLFQAANEAIRMSRLLLKPMAAMQWVDVMEVQQERVVCAGTDGKRKILHIGPKSSLLQGVRKLLVFAAALGDRIDQTLQSLNRKNELLPAYLLDTAGVLALEQVGAAICSFAEQEAERRCWGVSPYMSPGAVEGWDIADQKALCDLIPLDAINIRLTGNGTLIPFKSVTGIIGIGPGFGGSRVGSFCRVCSCASGCRMKKETATDEVTICG